MSRDPPINKTTVPCSCAVRAAVGGLKFNYVRLVIDHRILTPQPVAPGKERFFAS